ncbi:phosphotransferase family protein [Sphingomonas sp. SUN019]|uniref:phosphotransferase family protein n=1 Tax=Sphingomonas sp. SUN019 TaxID=2937788 RepID=UPI002164DC17|nr:phosphotransferase family protein [Sphingomonas sp. SUN019]UVO50950.1 phosphotransferase family protein [Sphingomonas sp. SUN019]
MSIAPQIETYLTRLWGSPVSVTDLARIPGGASRETYRFDATVDGAVRALILRREPAAGLIDTESATEYRAYQSAQGIVPVPAAVALEPDGAELERPFFIMERIDGGVVASAFERDPFGAHGAALGEQFFAALGRLAAHDPAGTPLVQHLDAPAPGQCWRVVLDYWEGVIDADSFSPQPIVRAAIRRLRANPPPPAQAVRIVHGDYRSGNMMHDGAGTMLAMLDWEMAHLGDPLEDLGWALDPIWTHFVEGKVGGMCAREQAIATWEAASGLSVDPAALAWWSLFNSVKGRAIWTSAFREFVDGGRIDPVLGLSGWYTARRQDAIIAEQLGGDAPSVDSVTGQSELGHILTGAGLVSAGAGQAAAEHDAFGGATVLVSGLLALLAAQEAEKAAAWRVADIAAMRVLLAADAPAIGDDATLPALDAEWATLSAALIDSARDDHAVLTFYRESAARRELTWPI